MTQQRFQQTISDIATVSGFGYWSGLDVTVEFRPAAPNSGITFVRSDLAGQPRISATIDQRVDALRRTTISRGWASVEMIEHVMAALYGMNIDNCEVWVNRAEMPGCDGSSKAFLEALKAIGIKRQTVFRKRLFVTDTIRVGDERNWLEASPAKKDHFRVAYELDYSNCELIGKQSIDLEITPDSFEKELSEARTFLLKAEADWIRQQGLGLRVSYEDVLVFDNDHVVENRLRFTDECVRHKTLDVIGDLAMIGCDLVGEFRACRSGHALNAEMVAELKHRYSNQFVTRAA